MRIAVTQYPIAAQRNRPKPGHDGRSGLAIEAAKSLALIGTVIFFIGQFLKL